MKEPITQEDKNRIEFAKICEIKLRNGGNLDLRTMQYYMYSVMRNKYIYIYNEIDAVIGFIIWADVNKESISRIIRTGTMPIYPHEWDEGNIALLLDISCGGKFLERNATKDLLSKTKFIGHCRRGALNLYFNVGNGRLKKTKLEDI